MDDRIFHAVQGFTGRYEVLDASFALVAEYMPHAMVALLVGLWFWPGERFKGDKWRWACLSAVGAALLSLGANQLLIRLWERPRPFEDHPALSLLPRSPDPSFPSDHATFGFAIAITLLLVHRRLGLGALGCAVWLALARVYVGEHYVGDVLAGAFVGSCVAVVTYQLCPIVFPRLAPLVRVARRWRLA